MTRQLLRHGLVAGVAAWLALSVPAGAQDPSHDPRWVAARWMIENQNIADLGPGLVVDTVNGVHGPGRGPLPSPDSALTASSRAIAAGFGGRTGTLRALMVCPPGVPDPRELRLRGPGRCRLTDGARAVLQVDAPEVTAEGLMVRVATWTFRERASGGQSVDLLSQEIFLREKATGGWEVAKLGLTVVGHW